MAMDEFLDGSVGRTNSGNDTTESKSGRIRGDNK